ncbi:HEAT repeat protein [Anseongella ginsenosidimutans]|uniref:HEAT repeat protein n=1 Tax=Anseongella ginsenosidimutans TaxID=496056 RepID=A0A4R3KR42_9SPHI|nr:family 16 glycoside hydrolase [Anseongella ginsenosidimutans]TCS86735.1 HEAT repeat protein [Anseongella ginsenosidimutans]
MLKKILLLFTAVLALNGAAMAQLDANRTVSTRIADLLAQMPAENGAELKQHAQEMAELGEAGIVQLADMLAAPGKGDNSRLEYAIGGFSFYVTQPGQEKWRALAQRAYCLSLEKEENKDVKAFLISQLQIVGGEDAVAALQSYLADERLCDPAARALVHIATPSAGKALLLALEDAPEGCRLSLVEALGDLRYTEAAEAIAPFAESDDKDLRKVALYALANIASPASAKVLSASAAESNYNFEETNATSSYLRYLDRLIEDGEDNTAAKLARKLMKKAKGSELVHTRTAALALLAEARGQEGLPYLLKAMKDDSPEYRRAALKFSGDISAPAAAAAWIKQLQRSKDAEVQSEIIAMLGNTQTSAALPVVSGFLKAGDQQVRLAAIKAVQQIGGVEALGSLLEVMKNGDEKEVQAVKEALLVMQGDGLPGQVAAALPAMPAPAKAALIDVLAARAADKNLDVVLAEVKSSDKAVRASAFAALGSMVTSKDLPALFALLNQVENDKEVSQVQDALVNALRDTEGEEAQTSLVLAQMQKAASGKKPRYLRLLASIGGAKALQAVAGAFDSGDAAEKEAALNALITWTDAGAAGELYRISREATGGSASKALEGYINLISKTDAPPAQKLLQLRKAMEIAKSAEQKKRIIAEVQKTGTFPALIFAGGFLNESDVQQAAAQAVMNIALDHKEYYGRAVKELLNKTIEVLKGQDSDYQKQAIRKHLSEMPADDGFVKLFNGKDLSGWKGLVANPIERAKMSAATLAKEQEKADERMREGWYAEDGNLIFTGHGDNICTVEEYGDFEMFIDWQIEADGDAGIYLRGTPQVQIWDTSRVDVGAQVGSGGLYNNQKHPSKPLVLADNAIGDWNTFHIIMKGEKVTVYLNGKLVVDNVVLENFWDRSQPIFPKEQLELQAHGTRVAYRDIYVRRLSREGEKFTLSKEEKEEGFEVLFDGTGLEKWTGNKEGYVIENGNIVIYPEKGNGNLFTKEEYADFNFRFEFQLTPGANNGLGIRAPLEGDAAYQGMELQILDNTADIYKDLQIYQYHGSVYGVIPAKRGFLKPVGEWNQQEVIVKGNKVKVILNGEVILDGDLAEASKNGTIDHREHPGLKKESGHIGFLGHGSVVRFRNIRIKDLGK